MLLGALLYESEGCDADACGFGARGHVLRETDDEQLDSGGCGKRVGAGQVHNIATFASVGGDTYTRKYVAPCGEGGTTECECRSCLPNRGDSGEDGWGWRYLYWCITGPRWSGDAFLDGGMRGAVGRERRWSLEQFSNPGEPCDDRGAPREDLRVDRWA